MIDFEHACSLIAGLHERTGIESTPLSQACGRVLARDVHAHVDSPRQRVSAMDGYAVREADLAILPVRLPVATTCYAGGSPAPDVPRGSCARIFTGASVSEDLDRVVIQEQVHEKAGEAIFEQAVGSGRHIRAQGSDFRRGDMLLIAGTRLDARAVVAAAGADRARVDVHLRPRVIVLGLGDELCAPGTARESELGVPESVSFGVAALVEQWGGVCIGRVLLPDVLDILERAAGGALEKADLVVVAGGASVGERDFAKAMFHPHGLELIFSKVAIKPGKPVWLGRAGGKLVLGLPGNPSSALVTARLFLAPLLMRLGGGRMADALRWIQAGLALEMAAGHERETFVRALWYEGRVLPLPEQDSSAQRALAQADVLIRRPSKADPVQMGGCVEVLEF
ncbi:molybdopterin molybdotransferase [Pseudoxanthomonas sp. 3HH-4]|uniref:molybdopterin molybdotransferase MoeA n=1 Tax=Pseudoxanthomonas sp. 3HH-4 TaxID=1690214 RepID=UPI00115060E2|nr:molybdopterin molybdotransferase MoeA [Pseudoxanthomonas sp. 3HH-4]TQM12299.1 molybdopterin molybdotransferase [Pseudoxanthomonas sp. 3HH-4]